MEKQIKNTKLISILDTENFNIVRYTNISKQYIPLNFYLVDGRIVFTPEILLEDDNVEFIEYLNVEVDNNISKVIGIYDISNGIEGIDANLYDEKYVKEERCKLSVSFILKLRKYIADNYNYVIKLFRNSAGYFQYQEDQFDLCKEVKSFSGYMLLRKHDDIKDTDVNLDCKTR
jgi:hypothetical protein